MHVKMEMIGRHTEMARALEAEMRVKGQSAGLRQLRQIMARMAKGELGLRVEVWRTAMRDEVRAKEMAEMQASLEARATEEARGAALRQLRKMLVRPVPVVCSLVHPHTLFLNVGPFFERLFRP